MVGPLAVERRSNRLSTSASRSSSPALPPSKLLPSCTDGFPPWTTVAMPALSTFASLSGSSMPLRQTGYRMVSASATCCRT